jgi:hypothetical protein
MPPTPFPESVIATTRHKWDYHISFPIRYSRAALPGKIAAFTAYDRIGCLFAHNATGHAW